MKGKKCLNDFIQNGHERKQVLLNKYDFSVICV